MTISNIGPILRLNIITATYRGTNQRSFVSRSFILSILLFWDSWFFCSNRSDLLPLFPFNISCAIHLFGEPLLVFILRAVRCITDRSDRSIFPQQSMLPHFRSSQSVQMATTCRKSRMKSSPPELLVKVRASMTGYEERKYHFRRELSDLKSLPHESRLSANTNEHLTPLPPARSTARLQDLARADIMPNDIFLLVNKRVFWLTNT
jgi:hypothetical protein